MMKRPIRILCCALALLWSVAPVALAQDRSEDERAVLETLDRLFEAMRTHDGEMARSAFAEDAVLISTEAPDGQPRTQIFPAERFIDAVASGTGEWDEPYWDPIVQIEDHIATVWTRYAFYLDGEFSHCGVDAVILARSADGWKIAALGDSREATNCELPPED